MSADVRTRLLAIRAETDRLREQVDGALAAFDEERPNVTEEVMKTAEYARHIRATPTTVRRYAKLGMPANRLGGELRIPVRDADRWIKEGGAAGAVARDAQENARRTG